MDERTVLPTTVGIVLKKPPFPRPLKIAKTVRGASDVDSSQMTNMLKALMESATNSVLIGPTVSQAKPHSTRPSADAIFKATRNPAAAVGENPRRTV